MKVPLKWLRDYVNITLPPKEIGRRLAMAGIEPAEIVTVGGSWHDVVIARVTAVNPHPNADRLRLATVDFGTGQETVVCGAPNLYVGDRVAYAPVGTRLLDGHSGEPFVLKPAKIRGVLSSGMICSEKELGISDDHQGIMVLPADAPVGTPLAEYQGDVIFDLEVTPNRPDCLSVIGIAREIAALTEQKIRVPEVRYKESALPIDSMVSVEIRDPELCPRYTATLITGISITPSPKWLHDRLIACGLRPINNIVDVSNYVMLEYGQPLHTFDFDCIRGKRIIVRRAMRDERLTTLDGVERPFTEDSLVVADAERAVALAGIMGGDNSQVSENTVNVLLEAGSWNPGGIRATCGELRIASDAAYRFERNLSAGVTVPALKRATQLIAELGGGEVAKGVIDVYPGRREEKPIVVTTKETKRVLGVGYSATRIAGVLDSLGFDCQKTSAPAGVFVTVPYWRSDIKLPVDVIEEVARIIGYDLMPSTMLSDPIPKQYPEPMVGLKQKVREILTGFGIQEILTYSMTSLDAQSRLLPESHISGIPMVRLYNPMSVEQELLRPNLRANVLTALATNRRFEDGGIRLFELGRVYVPKSDDLPDERESVCGVLSGNHHPQWWQNTQETMDFYDAKGVVEGLLSLLGAEVSFEKSSDESLHPAKQAAIIINGEKAGVVGEVHPSVLQAFDIAGTASMFELDLRTLLPLLALRKAYQPLPRYPTVTRDIAIIVDETVTHRMVVDIIRAFSLVREVSVFDVFAGGQIPPGKKSMAYRITYQSPTRTLTDEEVNRIQQQIVERLSRQLGATLRG